MIDMQAMVDNAVSRARSERMAKSDQLTLGEIITKLEATEDWANKKVRFDFGKVPTGIDSWRGSYAELSLHFGDGEGPLTSDLIKQLKDVVGKTLEGYKGGDFYMSRHTPVWVANWGEIGCNGWNGKDYPSVAILDVCDNGDFVEIKTAETEY